MSDKVLGHLLSEGSGVESKPEIVSANKMSVKIKAILQEGDVENRNRRIYPTNLLQEGLNAPYIKERLSSGTWFGECGHPMDPSIERQMQIDMTRVSHIIREYKVEKNLVRGIVETANTHVGRDMKGLIEQGCKVAFSFRGMAPIKKESGKLVVGGPLKMLCYDWVLHPSHAPAYMEGLVESASLIADESPVCVPLTEAAIREFLSREEGTLNEAAEVLLGAALSETSVGILGGAAVLKHGQTCARLFLEQTTLRKLDDYMASMLGR